MDGITHFRAAEQLANRAVNIPGGDVRDDTQTANTLALALVHATLALAAATALGAHPDGMCMDDLTAWEHAVSVAPARDEGDDA